MTATAKPMRIAIVLTGEDFICPPVTMPFSLKGHPPVDLVLFGAPSDDPASQVAALAGLRPEDFDLILDGEFLTTGKGSSTSLPAPSPAS
jgi:hypothetical protein